MDLATQRFLKYSQPGGRYTYAPGVGQWENNSDILSNEMWAQSDDPNQGIDLYIHLPFCPRLCTFCGCNIKITSDISEIEHYTKALLAQWQMYRSFLPQNIRLNSIYLGGGTPNYLSGELLELLLGTITASVETTESFHTTIEADPRISLNQNRQTLKDYRLKRINFGIQDLNPEVLSNVNRPQELKQIFDEIESLAKDFDIYADMIYGLPLQTPQELATSFQELLKLPLAGVAFYPLAPVPWQSKTQQAFGQYHPPSQEHKVELYLHGDQKLKENNYELLGFGHYVKKPGQLFEAFESGQLKRTPMGYTHSKSSQLIALGVSGIGYAGDTIYQNQRVLERYLHGITNQKELPIYRHHRQSPEQKYLQQIYHQISTQKIVDLGESYRTSDLMTSQMQELESDQIISIKDEHQITIKDRYFLKNICQRLSTAIQKHNGIN